MYICLDLSSTCTGWSKFSDDGKLIEHGRITSPPKMEPFHKIKYMVEGLEAIWLEADNVVIEGVFLGGFAGKNNVTVLTYLARLSGAVIFSWLRNHENLPKIYMAVQARSLAGIKGSSQKAQVQIWVCREYKYASEDKLDEYESMVESLQGEYNAGEITRAQFKYRMDKVSDIIDEETTIGEDTADSIVLGVAFNNERRKK